MIYTSLGARDELEALGRKAKELKRMVNLDINLSCSHYSNVCRMFPFSASLHLLILKNA